MRKILFFVMTALMAVACADQKGYTIKCKISGENSNLIDGTAYLTNRDKDNPFRDSAAIVKGSFTFKGSVVTPEYYYISVAGMPGTIPVYLENAAYTVTGTDTTFAAADVEGGEAQRVMNEYNKLMKDLGEKYELKKIMREYREATAERRDEIDKIYEEYENEFRSMRAALVMRNQISYFGLYALDADVYDLPVDSTAALVARFEKDPKFQGNRVLARVKDVLAKEKRVQVGEPAIDFTLNDPEGKPVTASGIWKNNKVTMIDFWAGWCSPCRNFNPRLLEIYKKYHKAGFEIIGLSLDRDMEYWKDAIKEDKLPWPQVSDLKYWQSEVPQNYNVRYIPQNVFVDGEGKIIARKLAEDEIEPFLKSVL